MTDLHDINTRKRGRQWTGVDYDMDSICQTCGWKYGVHFGYRCPDKFLVNHWECYVEGSDGGMHYRHLALQGARVEAERLARLPDNQGKRVYLFECVGQCSSEPVPVKWEFPKES